MIPPPETVLVETARVKCDGATDIAFVADGFDEDDFGRRDHGLRR